MSQPTPVEPPKVSSSPIKPSRVSGYEVSRPAAERNQILMVDDMRRQWVGLMPVQLFIDKFLPESKDCSATTTVPKDAFYIGKKYTQEHDMYQPFIDTLNKHGLIPGFKMVNTADYKDRESYKGREVKPDPSIYKATVNTEVKKTQFDKLELNVEFKTTDKDDPFCDPLTPISDMSLEDKRNTSFISDSQNRTACLGQLSTYAAEWFGRQHRCFGFTIFIADPYIRFIRWDRAGGIVTQRFDFRNDCGFLTEFLWRFSHSDDASRGLDTTVRDPSEKEAELARTLLAEYKKPKERPVKVFSVPSQDGPREFVGWYPKAEPWGLTGRCTRAYPVVELKTKKKMFLKDVWRASVLEKESDILQTLNQGSVQYVPTLVCGDDLEGHVTLTNEFVPMDPTDDSSSDESSEDTDDSSESSDEDPGESSTPGTVDRDTSWVLGSNWDRITQRIHNRLVVDVVAQPLEEFKSTKEMLQAVSHAFTAHKQACTRCRIMHRDISLGNIMIDANGNGVLIDWDLSRRMDEMEDGPRDHERTGTWAFMSYLLQRTYDKIHTIQDDMESFLWVVLYIALRYVANTHPQPSLPLEHIFDWSYKDHNGRTVGGNHKKLAMIDPDDYLIGFGLPGNEPLMKWIKQVFKWVDDWVSAHKPSMVTPIIDRKLDLEDHTAMEILFESVLAETGWSADAKAKDVLSGTQKVVKSQHPHRSQASSRKRSKRSPTSSSADESSSSRAKKPRKQ